MARRDWTRAREMQLVCPDALPGVSQVEMVKHELLFALEHKAYKGHILVLSLRGAKFKKLSWTLSQFQWIDFTGGFDRGCEALLRVWRKTRRRS